MPTELQPVMIKNRISEFKRRINQCQEGILLLQRNCSHDFRKVWAKLTTDQDQFKVVAYKCAICEVEKARNSAATHCYVCDGKMKAMGYVPGQGGGCHLEKCIECGRHSDSDNYGIYRFSIPKEDYFA